MSKHFSKELLVAAVIRAIRTMAQTALSFITVGALVSEINWLAVASTAVVAGVYSILLSIATGLPETSTDALVGSLTVVESSEGHKPELLLQLDDEKAIDVIKNNGVVRVSTSNLTTPHHQV